MLQTQNKRKQQTSEKQQKTTMKLTPANPSIMHAKFNCYKLACVAYHCSQQQVPLASF